MVPGGLREQSFHKVEPESEKLSIQVEGLYRTEEQVWEDELDMVMEVVAAEGVMEGVMVDIVDLEVMVAAMAVILVIVVEEAMVVVDQDMETKVVDMVIVVEDMMVSMKEDILEATMVVVEVVDMVAENSKHSEEKDYSS